MRANTFRVWTKPKRGHATSDDDDGTRDAAIAKWRSCRRPGSRPEKQAGSYAGCADPTGIARPSTSVAGSRKPCGNGRYAACGRVGNRETVIGAGRAGSRMLWATAPESWWSRVVTMIARTPPRLDPTTTGSRPNRVRAHRTSAPHRPRRPGRGARAPREPPAACRAVLLRGRVRMPARPAGDASAPDRAPR